MIPFRKSFEVVGYAYGADMHCLVCASHAFGSVVFESWWPSEDVVDVSPIFLDETDGTEVCGSCLGVLDQAAPTVLD